MNAICLSSKRWAKCYHSPLHSGDQFSHINKATLRFSMAPLFESIESHSDAIPLANTIGKFRFYRALNFCTTHTNTHKNAQTLEKKPRSCKKWHSEWMIAICRPWSECPHIWWYTEALLTARKMIRGKLERNECDIIVVRAAFITLIDCIIWSQQLS